MRGAEQSQAGGGDLGPVSGPGPRITGNGQSLEQPPPATVRAVPAQPLGNRAKAGRTSNALGLFYFILHKWRQNWFLVWSQAFQVITSLPAPPEGKRQRRRGLQLPPHTEPPPDRAAAVSPLARPSGKGCPLCKPLLGHSLPVLPWQVTQPLHTSVSQIAKRSGSVFHRGFRA